MSKTNGNGHKANGNGNGKKRVRPPKNKCTALQIVPKINPRGGGPPKTSLHRKLFLMAYEANGGIISQACQMSGISRETYYRWMDSPSRINVVFRQRLARLRPKERFIDHAELTILDAIKGGDITASIFTLKTQGRHRGWSERPLEQAIIDSAAMSPVLAAYQKILSMNPDLTEAERSLWIKDLASTAGIAEDALTRRIKVLELTAKV